MSLDLSLQKESIALIPEGPSEAAYLNILLDGHKLIFTREELLDNRVLSHRNKIGRVFTNNYLVQTRKSNLRLDILLIQDKIIPFYIKDPYTEKINQPIYVLTSPELEMLPIIHLDLYDEYQKVKTEQSPAKFLSGKLKRKEAIIKSRKFIQSMFDPDTLELAVRNYGSLAPRLPRNAVHLAALLKN